MSPQANVTSKCCKIAQIIFQQKFALDFLLFEQSWQDGGGGKFCDLFCLHLVLMLQNKLLGKIGLYH